MDIADVAQKTFCGYYEYFLDWKWPENGDCIGGEVIVKPQKSVAPWKLMRGH